jgi:hypothetical protein
VAAAVVVIALTLVCASTTQAAVGTTPQAHTAAVGLGISMRPALQPAFAPTVHDYVTRCEPVEVMRVQVRDPGGAAVAVDRQPVQHRGFSTSLRLGPGQRFVITTGAGSGRSSYSVRCLPPDFPHYTTQVFGRAQAAYYLMTPSASTSNAPGAPYVALFDHNGVPVWWYREPSGAPTNANVLSNGDLSWSLEKPLLHQSSPPALSWEVTSGFGEPSQYDLVEHRLDGSLVRTVDSVGSPTDFHEGTQLPDGDFLITSYVVRRGANLSPVFYGPATALDASFQVVRPNGSMVASWDSAGIISPSESTRWWFALDFGYPKVPGTLWDYAHINSVEPDGDGYLISLAHTDAVYLVRASDGAVEWKLGGTSTSHSLRIIGDPYGSSDFGGQDDARVWPDGTVSVFDDGVNRRRPPRVLRFRINPAAGTATLIQTLTDPVAPVAPCCGSARMLPGGDWVVDWGGTGIMDELAPDGSPVVRITLAAPYFSYRAVPVLPGQLRYGAMVAGMNTMVPRTASGDRPPALSGLRVSAGRVHFTLAWRATVTFLLERATGAVFAAAGPTVRVAGRGGANTVSISRIARHGLAPGTYRLIARSAAHGHVSLPSGVVFQIG